MANFWANPARSEFPKSTTALVIVVMIMIYYENEV